MPICFLYLLLILKIYLETGGSSNTLSAALCLLRLSKAGSHFPKQMLLPFPLWLFPIKANKNEIVEKLSPLLHRICSAFLYKDVKTSTQKASKEDATCISGLFILQLLVIYRWVLFYTLKFLCIYSNTIKHTCILGHLSEKPLACRYLAKMFLFCIASHLLVSAIINKLCFFSLAWLYPHFLGIWRKECVPIMFMGMEERNALRPGNPGQITTGKLLNTPPVIPKGVATIQSLR